MVDAAEVKHRQRMDALLSASELQVAAGNIPEWIKRHFFCEEHLETVTRTVGLPSEAATQLLTIAVFLDKALSVAPCRTKGAKPLSRELNAIKSAHRKLFDGLSNISTDAYHWLCRVDESTDEAGQPSWEWKSPPVEETLNLLKDLGKWLNEAELAAWRPGPRKSAKFYAILLLRNVMQEHKGEVLLDELTELANSVVWPIADHHGDDGDLGKFVKEATKGIART